MWNSPYVVEDVTRGVFVDIITKGEGVRCTTNLLCTVSGAHGIILGFLRKLTQTQQ